jgi:hypothetical protein
MCIGNIVCDTDLKVDKNFKVVKSIDEINNKRPTLIVGIKNAEKVSKDLNYADRTLSDNMVWTFSKLEKRSIHEEDLFFFIENSYNKLIKNIDYIFVDLILFDNKKINKIFNRLSENPSNITLCTNNMVYIYCDDYIFGFNLKQVEYIGKDKKNFINKIKSLSMVFLDDEKILIEYKNYLGMLNDEIKFIPLLYSIRNNG